jgi:hypothetical protein
MTHALFWQLDVPFEGLVQAVVHVPQCWSFEVRSAHDPLQFVGAFGGQVSVHAAVPASPSVQTMPPSQAAPHAPHALVVVMLVSHPTPVAAQCA